MMLKYSEVFLGLKYRVPNNSGGYNGGPMYFLRHVFKKSWIPNFVALLLCIYGVEVYQFNVVVTSITSNIDFNEYVVSVVLLLFVLFAGSGGVRRVGNIASAAIPLFVILYVAMGFWVMAQNIHRFPEIFGLVLSSAFTGHAALGAFIGSPFLLTMSEGVRRGCYTGDVGVGYASVIHSESFVQIPEKQALLAIFDIFTDTIVICSTSIMLVLLTGVWHESIDTSLMVQTALSQYFPYMHFFMPFFLFILGYSTINAYFVVGLKCAGLLAPKIGPTLYYIYAIVALLLFSIIETRQAQLIMSIAGGLLLIINCYGIFRLRKEISYDFEFVEKSLEKNRVI
jgi:alanine or glycine:cation symporter, AGCS family